MDILSSVGTNYRATALVSFEHVDGNHEIGIFRNLLLDPIRFHWPHAFKQWWKDL